MSAAVRAIGLDVMDTVLRDPWKEALEEVTGLPLSRVAELRDPRAWVSFERGEIDEREYGRRFFPPGTGRALDVRAFREALSRRYAFLPGMEALLGRLAAGGHPLVALWNYPRWAEGLGRRFRLERFFERTFLSARLGVRKPEPEFYRRVLETLGIPPDALFFVDDREANVEGARSMGIDAAVFCGAEALEGELRARGLLGGA